MSFFVAQIAFNPIDLAVFLVLAICAAAWLWIALRANHGRPVAAYQPRRVVPWSLGDLIVIAAFYLVWQTAIIGTATLAAGQNVETTQTYGSEHSTTEHVVGQLIAEGNFWVFLLCGIAAVVVAPATEEFFFRVLLQGWLEAVEHRWRRRVPNLRRVFSRGVVPVVLTSLLFARLHFRVETPQLSATTLILLLAGDAVARVITVGFAVWLLRFRTGATVADLGWTPGKFWGDVELGIGVFLAVSVPIYAMQVGLQNLLPSYIAPDPIPLFFFSLALGLIYYRTHRLLPLIVIHAALNGTSLLLVWLSS